MTARLAPHPHVAGWMPEVVDRLVAAGLDVEVLNEEPRGDSDPLEGVRDGSLDLALVGARALRESAADDLTTVAVLPRAEYRDVLVTLRGAPEPISRMKRGSRVALRGARRSAFLRAHRPDAEVVELDGAADRAGEDLGERADALVTGTLEARRLGLHHRVAEALDPRAWPPEPGQGALALIARHPIAEATALDHLPTRTALRTELALLDALGVDPDAPVGSLALTSGRWIRLWAAAASRDGGRLVRSDLTGPLDEPEALGTAVARQLADRGIALVLAGAA